MEAKQDSTCDSCVNIGGIYNNNGFAPDYICKKESVRRAEGMPKRADFIAHFRAFFDAHSGQTACRHYEERPIAEGQVMDLLILISKSGGRAEFKFFSDENGLAEKLDGKFVKHDWYGKPTVPGGRIYELTAVGRHEVARAAIAKAKGESR